MPLSKYYLSYITMVSFIGGEMHSNLRNCATDYRQSL